jgi:hypothetical protein
VGVPQSFFTVHNECGTKILAPQKKISKPQLKFRGNGLAFLVRLAPLSWHCQEKPPTTTTKQQTMFKLFAFSLITIATAKHDYVRQTKFGTENVAGWLNETQDAVQGTTSSFIIIPLLGCGLV